MTSIPNTRKFYSCFLSTQYCMWNTLSLWLFRRVLFLALTDHKHFFWSVWTKKSTTFIELLIFTLRTQLLPLSSFYIGFLFGDIGLISCGFMGICGNESADLEAKDGCHQHIFLVISLCPIHVSGYCCFVCEDWWGSLVVGLKQVMGSEGIGCRLVF